MAEARSAVTEPRVGEIEEGKNPRWDFIVAWRKNTIRRFYRTRNLIRNGMWPTSMWNLGVSVGTMSTLLIGDWEFAKPITSRLWAAAEKLHIHDGIPYYLRVVVLSTSVGFISFLALLYIRRYTLRLLLSYKGWMYQAPRTQSITTILWGLVVRLVSGPRPYMYSCQQSLPRMPVPPLKDTLKMFIESLKPLYGEDSEEYKKLKAQSKEFGRSQGLRYQSIIKLRSWWAQNWYSDWWEKYVYLMGRSPIAINSNYYILDESYWQPTHKQVSRAAGVCYQYHSFKRLCDREELLPLVIRNTIPLCMAQYERMFSTVRIPGEDIDELVHFTTAQSKHIAVQRKGVIYKVNMFDKKGQPLQPSTMEKHFQWIIEDADKHEGDYSEAAKSLSSLTGIDRTEWAKTRQQHFTKGVNKESMDVVDSAMFMVILETKAFEDFSQRGKYLLHGDGKSIWFDKSFTLVIFSDGRFGMNVEHSWADAPVIAHAGEYCMTNEVLESPALYDSEGRCIDIDSRVTQASVTQPERLVWEVPKPLEATIQRAISFCQKNNDDLELVVSDHDAYGKGFIKKCKVSPDAFVQMALQLAYYKDSGKFVLVYESSMTRLYLLGRTETVRSLTVESQDFVKAMVDKQKTSEEKIKLLQRACVKHQKLYRDAMCGSGIDRHLFGLFVVCKGMGKESDFLKTALTIPWTLSTSQQPQQQMINTPSCDLPRFKNMVSPGGGFGPVSDDGYGVSYMIPGNQKIFFHVSCKGSSGKTNALRFTNLLNETLKEMRELFEPSSATNGTTSASNSTKTVENGTN